VGRWSWNVELVSFWKEEVMANIEVLSWQLSGEVSARFLVLPLLTFLFNNKMLWKDYTIPVYCPLLQSVW
jgi:hypothetical protein